jgi:hypothetical protein
LLVIDNGCPANYFRQSHENHEPQLVIFLWETGWRWPRMGPTLPLRGVCCESVQAIRAVEFDNAVDCGPRIIQNSIISGEDYVDQA